MVKINEKGQAVAPERILMNNDNFADNGRTEVYWLGGAGLMINDHGTNVMIDPVLEGFDMPLLYETPILPEGVPSLDAVLITHIDNDHFSRPTCTDLKGVCRGYHAPNYVADVMKDEGYNVTKHDIGETFEVNDIKVTLTRAVHNWQNFVKKWQYRVWEEKDYCGYWFEIRGKKIWLPGDSKLVEEHLHMDDPDIILFDFADNDWHITFDGAVKLANTYPDAKLICIHWGSVDSPEMTPFNGNPDRVRESVVNPERVVVLAPGEAYIVEE